MVGDLAADVLPVLGIARPEILVPRACSSRRCPVFRRIGLDDVVVVPGSAGRVGARACRGAGRNSFRLGHIERHAQRDDPIGRPAAADDLIVGVLGDDLIAEVAGLLEDWKWNATLSSARRMASRDLNGAITGEPRISKGVRVARRGRRQKAQAMGTPSAAYFT